MKHFLPIVLLASCFCPPIKVFSDEWILPKWYLGALCLLFVVLWIIVSNSYSRENLCKHITEFCVIAGYVCIVECLYAVALLFFHHGNMDYGVQGTFDNPAALALHLCLLLPCVVKILESSLHDRLSVRRILLIAGIALIVVTITLTISRTGLICLAVMLAIDALIRLHVKSRVKVSMVCCIILSSITYCLINKQESTTGRKFILSTTWNLIKDHPIKGYGSEKFHKEYMVRQCDFFKENPESNYSMLADDIRHPLNEFLYLWVNYGIAGPAMLLILLIVPWLYFWKRKGLVGLKMAATIFIFSSFSYPLHYPLTWLLLIGLDGYVAYDIVCRHYSLSKETQTVLKSGSFKYVSLMVGVMISAALLYNGYYEYRFGKVERRALKGHSREMLSDYHKLLSHFRNDPYFLYSYMSSQYRSGHFADAVATYGKLSAIDGGYDVELLAGDTYRQMGMYDKANDHYGTASHMCPCRFAPLEGLLLSYQFHGKKDSADYVAKQILKKEVKVPSPVISYIQDEAKDWLKKNRDFSKYN